MNAAAEPPKPKQPDPEPPILVAQGFIFIGTKAAD